MVISVDWGGYDYDALQVENLATKANCGLFISQLGGAGTRKLLARAKTSGMLTGGYCWNSALNSAQTQIDEFSKDIDAENPDVILLDFEQWWSDWAKYWAAIAGTLPWAQVPKLDPQKISDNGQAVCEGIVSRYPEKYYLNYSAQWFVNGYSLPSASWLKIYPFHVASYLDYGISPYPLTWEQISAGNYQMTNGVIGKVSEQQPAMPTGMTKWDMWQYSSRIKVPGEYYGYDFDYFPGTLDELRALCRKKVINPPPVTTVEERLTALEKRVTVLENK